MTVAMPFCPEPFIPLLAAGRGCGAVGTGLGTVLMVGAGCAPEWNATGGGRGRGAGGYLGFRSTGWRGWPMRSFIFPRFANVSSITAIAARYEAQSETKEKGADESTHSLFYRFAAIHSHENPSVFSQVLRALSHEAWSVRMLEAA